MLDINKTDPVLGLKVHNHLVELGCETPTTLNNTFTPKQQITRIESAFTKVMDTLRLDLSDDSLQDTPKRVAKMYTNETFWGLNYANFPKITVVENKAGYNDLVIEKTKVTSSCEHHWVYFGTAHNPDLGCWIAYIPDKKVVGLSKLNRVTEFFSRRPQIQERLTRQIAETLKFLLETDDVAVVIKAQHFCVLTRGIEDTTGYTITSSVHGRFSSEPALRAELMQLVNAK